MERFVRKFSLYPFLFNLVYITPQIQSKKKLVDKSNWHTYANYDHNYGIFTRNYILHTQNYCETLRDICIRVYVRYMSKGNVIAETFSFEPFSGKFRHRLNTSAYKCLLIIPLYGIRLKVYNGFRRKLFRRNEREAFIRLFRMRTS